jgi:beta-glucanase (GH16 family)
MTAATTGRRRLTGRLLASALRCAAAAVVLATCSSGNAAGRSVRADAEPFVVDALDESWHLVFADDFERPDGQLASWWSTCHWWQIDGGCTIASNDEQQWYQPSAVSVRDGFLSLEAIVEAQVAVDGVRLPLTSGMVSTGPSRDGATPGFAFTYGIAEARVRLPEAAGSWPAVWMLPADQESLPEIDLLEWYGGRPDLVTSHVHAEVDGERRSQRVETQIDDGRGRWHVVTVRWESDAVEFFLDGVRTGIVDDPDLVPHEPMYLVVNLAMGGVAGEVELAALPDRFLVDDVRVWQRGGT